MHPANFTDISDLIGKSNTHPSPFFSYGGSPEQEKTPLENKQEDSEHIEMHEVVEHEPDKEVQEYVQHRKDVVEVPPELKQLGVQANTATNFPTYQKVELPISDEKVMVGLKAPISSSLRWLAEICIFFLKQAHLTLKMVHGKVVRVLMRG